MREIYVFHKVINDTVWTNGGDIPLNYLDMLTKLGVGNAHPGGFSETLELIGKLSFPLGSHILEVGCGTGRTACFLAARGYKVTALDIRPEMVLKARIRAEKEQVQVLWVEGDACQLPFDEQTFDMVMVESVSNFTDATKAISEYFRVLKAGGVMVDREVIRTKELPPEAKQIICSFYGVYDLWTAEEWLSELKACGYRDVKAVGIHAFPTHMWEDSINHPDPVRLADEGSMLDPQIWSLIADYDQITEQYRDYMGYTVLSGRK
jgi:SAM-dependent methyltransferase